MFIEKSLTVVVTVSIVIFAIAGYILSYFIPWWAAYIFFSSSVGWFHLEMVWPRMERYLEINESRDRHFPAFRRLDNQNWTKAMFYPMALTIYTTRILFCIGSFGVCAMGLKVIMLGQDRT
jgi:hypothetical protein